MRSPPTSHDFGTTLLFSCATSAVLPQLPTSTRVIFETLYRGARKIMFLNYLQDHCENNPLLIMKIAVCVKERPLVLVQFTSSFAVL